MVLFRSPLVSLEKLHRLTARCQMVEPPLSERMRLQTVEIKTEPEDLEAVAGQATLADPLNMEEAVEEAQGLALTEYTLEVILLLLAVSTAVPVELTEVVEEAEAEEVVIGTLLLLTIQALILEDLEVKAGTHLPTEKAEAERLENLQKQR